MKRKQIQWICLTGACMALLAGCGSVSGILKGTDSSQPQNSETPAAADDSELYSDETSDEIPSPPMETETGAWLPSHIERVYSERDPSVVIQGAIIDYFELPEDEWEETRYYYNYVNLDDDDDEEILALVVGPSFSGSGGSTALWLEPSDNMAVVQDFSLANNPILVTDDANGQGRGLIMERSGGGAEAETVLLTFDGKNYCSVSDAEPIEDVSAIEGTAILCDDLAADMQSGDFMTLAD